LHRLGSVARCRSGWTGELRFQLAGSALKGDAAHSQFSRRLEGHSARSTQWILRMKILYHTAAAFNTAQVIENRQFMMR
jgi:hypothetical protein